MILAEGKKENREMTVVYDAGRFMFDGKPDIFYEDEIKYEIERRHPIGGTYYTDDFNLNLVEVLTNWFFDKPAKRVSVGKSEKIEDIPFEKGVVY